MSHSNKILFGDSVAMTEWVRMQFSKKTGKLSSGRDINGHNLNYRKCNVWKCLPKPRGFMLSLFRIHNMYHQLGHKRNLRNKKV
jgi:hypothetical protein